VSRGPKLCPGGQSQRSVQGAEARAPSRWSELPQGNRGSVRLARAVSMRLEFCPGGQSCVQETEARAPSRWSELPPGDRGSIRVARPVSMRPVCCPRVQRYVQETEALSRGPEPMLPLGATPIYLPLGRSGLQ
jgi:hypothetical protein